MDKSEEIGQRLDKELARSRRLWKKKLRPAPRNALHDSFARFRLLTDAARSWKRAIRLARRACKRRSFLATKEQCTQPWAASERSDSATAIRPTTQFPNISTNTAEFVMVFKFVTLIILVGSVLSMV